MGWFARREVMARIRGVRDLRGCVCMGIVLCARSTVQYV